MWIDDDHNHYIYGRGKIMVERKIEK